jgi:RraA family protein
MKSSSNIINPACLVDPSNCFEILKNLPVAILSDNLSRLNGCTGLHSFGAPVKMVGTALTVKVRPGDNLLIYKAIQQLLPGHVLVIDGGADPNNALVGDLILQYAMQRGCTGFVVDAAIRDRSSFIEKNFPCHARAISHRGPYKFGPGHINIPIAIGGDVISPGDYIVADEDGILSFAPDLANDLIKRAQLSLTREQAISTEIANGKVEQEWMKNVLSPFNL